jgi:hypothetical protein
MTVASENQYSESVLTNARNLTLATGNAIGWLTLLGHLGVFDPFYKIFQTICHALLTIAHFSLCAVFAICGFIFSGWLVFGPIIGLKFHFSRWVLSTTTPNWISSGYLNQKIPLEDFLLELGISNGYVFGHIFISGFSPYKLSKSACGGG